MTDQEIAREATRRFRKSHRTFFAIFFTSSVLALLGSIAFHNLGVFSFVSAFCLGWMLSSFKRYSTFLAEVQDERRVDGSAR